VFGDPTYADAILDRLVHNAHRIDLAGDSLRRRRDEKGNLTSMTNALGNVVSFPRNSDGTVRAIERPRGKTIFDYSYGDGGEPRAVKNTWPIPHPS
jgi:YD repeat-containing protein